MPPSLSFPTNTGNLDGAANVADGSCQTALGGGGGADDVYVVTAPSDGLARLTLTAAADLGVFVQTSCGDVMSEVACEDDVVGGADEVLELLVSQGQTFFVFVGGFTEADAGDYTLTVAFGAPTDGTCNAPLALAPNDAVIGNTVGASDLSASSCQEAGGLDVAYVVTAPVAGTLSLQLGSDDDLGLFAQTTCGDAASELGCADVDFDVGGIENLSLPMQANETIFVFVGGFNAASAGPFSLTSSFVEDATGTCADPFAAAVPGNIVGDTTGAADETSSSCQQAGGVDDVHVLTAPGTGTLELVLTSDADLGVFLQAACGPGGAELGCADAVAGPAAVETLSVAVVEGETLFVVVGGFVTGEAGPYTLDVAFTGLEDGSCIGPRPASLPGTVAGDVTGQQDVAQGTCQLGGGADDVHVVTPDADGVLALTLTSAADLGVFVQTACGEQASELGCADALVGGAEPETLSVNVTAGVPLFVIVGGFTGADASAYTLDMVFTESGTCAAPFAASVGTTVIGDVTDANQIADGSCQLGQGGSLGLDEVYAVVAPGDGLLNLVLDSVADLGLFVHTGCGDAVTEVACVDDAFGAGNTIETLNVAVTGGQTVFVFVGAFTSGTEGSYTLDIGFTPGP